METNNTEASTGKENEGSIGTIVNKKFILSKTIELKSAGSMIEFTEKEKIPEIAHRNYTGITEPMLYLISKQLKEYLDNLFPETEDNYGKKYIIELSLCLKESHI